ncbi:hypothetical protein TH63_10810 [Rufibacter radiotolerans]|uniref:Uncharacterized protein n=1 Tax=Rufibacter radiotolerans TaxID=1379910 RepID=A0A0H4W6F7_9BACT|nr:hypothetical protein [Rufibacter radiotolerans]AKQ46016.1 hypothetical protein TH63_10810 [Rufibacter radiotolerans]
MKTTIAYAELNNELQELYLAAKVWVSELEFLEREYEFLKKLLTTALLPLVQRDTLARVSDIQLLALKTAKRQEGLKKEIGLYLQRVETYITDSDQQLDITLVETHAALAAELALVKWNLGALRTQVFLLSKEGKNEYSTH